MKKSYHFYFLPYQHSSLISCLSQDNLDGNYYWIDAENGLRNELLFSIKGTEHEYYIEG